MASAGASNFDHASDCNVRVESLAEVSSTPNNVRFTQPTDIAEHEHEVRKSAIPRHRAQLNSDGCHESNRLEVRLHSMTLSARSKRSAGISWLIALAVLRLITSSNRVGCSTGMSTGLVPRSTLTTIRAS